MSQDSYHGKWTVSSSDDEDGEALPLSGTTTVEADQLGAPASSSPQSAPSPRLGLKAEPEAETPGRPDPVKEDKRPPLAGKRKNEVSDGSGWALSDSDEEEDKAGKTRRPGPEEEPASRKAKKVKVESERPPSPHGRTYYMDEPEDFFESSVPCLNDRYRFYLNKVTGVERKYNRGALHIRGERPGPGAWGPGPGPAFPSPRHPLVDAFALLHFRHSLALVRDPEGIGAGG